MRAFLVLLVLVVSIPLASAAVPAFATASHLLTPQMPKVGATKVSKDAAIYLSFAGVVAAHTGAGNIVLTPTGGGSTVTCAPDGTTGCTRTISTDKKTVKIKPAAALVEGKEYTVTLSADGYLKTDTTTDLMAVALIANLNYKFTVAAAADITKPTLTSKLPFAGAADVAVAANIWLNFGQEMYPSPGQNLVTSTITYTPAGGTAVALTLPNAIVTHTGDKKGFKYDPAANMATDKEQTITIAADSFFDISGNGNAAITYKFSTATVVAPQFVSTATVAYVPNKAGTTSGKAVNIQLTFDSDMAVGAGDITWTPAAGATKTLTVAELGTQAADADGVMTCTGKVCIINPAVDLVDDKEYTIVVAAATLLDTSGNAIATGITGTNYKFTTKAAQAAPTVSTYNPANAATAVAVGSNIELTFSATVAKGVGNIVLTPASGTAVTIDVQSSQVTIAATKATINPTADLSAGVKYTVTTSAGGVFKDSAGNEYTQLSGTTYQFTTAAATNSTTGSSAAAATGTDSTVTQKYTFASITAAQYTGKMKSNCECAYANTVEGATTPSWCVATTSAYTYKSGVAMSSSAVARRAATVTFVLKVKSSVKTLSQLQTLVASGSTAAKFATALNAVNTASNYTAVPGAATVAAATFAGSSASTLLPSMLSLVAAIFVAARQ